MNKKVLLSVISVAIVLLLITGATFAYLYTTLDNGNTVANVSTAQVSNVQLTNAMIGVSDILPGYESAARNITASASISGNVTIPYKCKISQSSNALVDLEYLVVAGSGMSSTTNNTWTSVPTTATTFLTGVLTASSSSQTSTIKFRLHETGTNQTAGESGVNSTVTVACTLEGENQYYSYEDISNISALSGDYIAYDLRGGEYFGTTITNKSYLYTTADAAINAYYKDLNPNFEFYSLSQFYDLCHFYSYCPYFALLSDSDENGVRIEIYKDNYDEYSPAPVLTIYNYPEDYLSNKTDLYNYFSNIDGSTCLESSSQGINTYTCSTNKGLTVSISDNGQGTINNDLTDYYNTYMQTSFKDLLIPYFKYIIEDDKIKEAYFEFSVTSNSASVSDYYINLNPGFYSLKLVDYADEDTYEYNKAELNRLYSTGCSESTSNNGKTYSCDNGHWMTIDTELVNNSTYNYVGAGAGYFRLFEVPMNNLFYIRFSSNTYGLYTHSGYSD